MQDLLSRIDGINIASWSPAAMTALRIAVIIIVAWILIGVLQRLIRTFREKIAERLGDADAAQRAATLGAVFRYIVAVVVSAVALMLILSELGISLAPVLGAAGVAGLAVGFGAQSLVKDYVTGFFILLEDQIRKGDVVNVADIGGVVENVTLRHTRLRDYDGNVHYIPNGNISNVTNMSRGFAQSVMDIGIAYREDIDEAYRVMRETASDMRADPEFASKILEDLEIAGVERWDDSAVTIRCRFKTAPLQQWAVRRDYLRRLKYAFDRHGIEIPYPHLTVYAGVGKDGTAPALPLKVEGLPQKT